MLNKNVIVQLEFGSFLELEYTLNHVSATGLDVRLCVLDEEGGVLTATIQFPARWPALAFALGMWRALARQIVEEGTTVWGVRGDRSGIEKYLGTCQDAEELFDDTAVKAYINFYDADAVEPTLSRFHYETPFKAAVLSKEEDTAGYIVHLSINSVDPAALVLLGEIFAEEYEKVC